MKKLINISVLFFLLISISSCDTVHEFPEEQQQVNVQIKFKMASNVSDLADYQVIEYNPNNRRKVNSETDTYKIRYIVEIYEEGRKLERKYFYTDGIQSGEISFEMLLPMEKQYEVVAWLDRVNAEKRSDLFYNTSNIHAIGILTDNYYANTDLKDALTGSLIFRSDAQDTDSDGVIHKEIELTRPLAKIRVLSTDKQEYINRTHKQPHTIKFIYEQRLPTFISVSRNELTNYMDGFTATAIVADLNDEEYLLFSDWVFATATATEMIIHASFEVYDEDNTLITKTPVIQVPLMRNKQTTIRGRFLTTNFNEGIGIDDNFDDEIVIEF